MEFKQDETNAKDELISTILLFLVMLHVVFTAVAPFQLYNYKNNQIDKHNKSVIDKQVEIINSFKDSNKYKIIYNNNGNVNDLPNNKTNINFIRHIQNKEDLDNNISEITNGYNINVIEDSIILFDDKEISMLFYNVNTDSNGNIQSIDSSYKRENNNIVYDNFEPSKSSTEDENRLKELGSTLGFMILLFSPVYTSIFAVNHKHLKNRKFHITNILIITISVSIISIIFYIRN